MIALLATAALAASPTSGSGDNAVLRAMRDELERSKARLVLPGEPKPYFIAYAVEDYDQITVSASFGAIQSNSHDRRRFLRAWVRVGDPTLDNSNFFRTSGFGPSAGVEWIQLDDDYDALRREMWLATDRAYKDAVEALEAKRGAMKDEAAPADDVGVPDFSTEKPAHVVVPGSPPKVPDAATLAALAKRLSEVFRDFPQIQSDLVTISAATSERDFLSTEGAETRVPQSLVRVEIVCSTQADDGMEVHDFATFAAPSLEGLPPAADLAKEARRVAAELVTLRAAPVASDYSGPVLFEGRAAAQLVRVMLSGALSGTPPARSDAPSMAGLYGQDTPFASKVGLRVLPLGYRVEDDPGLRAWHGLPLLGGYPADDEGVPPQKATLVENGKLKGFLMSRTPRKGFLQSNGHGRTTLSGEPRGMIGNLIVIPPAKEALSSAALRQRLLSEARDEGYSYGIVVRLLDDASITRQLGDSSRSVFGHGSDDSPALPAPVVLVKVTADGKEEWVRGATLGNLPIRALRDVLAAGREPQVLSYFVTGGGAFSSTAPASTPSIFVIPASIVAPSLLVKDLDVKKPSGSNPKLPLLAHPYFVTAK